MKPVQFDSFKALRNEMRFAFKMGWIASGLVVLGSLKHDEGAWRVLSMVVWGVSTIYCFVQWWRLRQPISIHDTSGRVSVSYGRKGDADAHS